jgi:hypothetical protein
MTICTQCNQPATSGYETDDGIFCVSCEHRKQWKRDVDFAPRDNPRQAREDARQDAIAEIIADDYLNHLIHLRVVK